MSRRLLATLLGLLLIAALLAIRIADPYPVATARAASFDILQQLAPRPKSQAPVRIVDIDEASLREIGQWPWPRNIMAQLTDRLAELGAASIGFDALFPEPDRLSPSRLAQTPLAWAEGGAAALPDFDQQFAASLAAAPSILGFSAEGVATSADVPPKAGFAVSGSDPARAVVPLADAVMPLPALASAAKGLGGLSLDSEANAGVVRQVPLLWRAGGRYYPSLALESLRVALGESTFVILGDTSGAGLVEGVRIGDFTVPTTPAGDLTIYYSRPDPALYISARDLLRADYRDLAPLVEGRIVLIGSSASGLLDLHATALGQNLPGVAIHAQAIQQILDGRYLMRTDWVGGLELASFVVIGLAIVGLVLRVGPLSALMVGVSLAGVTVAGSWFLFRRYGLLVDPSFSAIAGFVLYSAMVFLRFALTDAERRHIRRAFGHYVSPALLAEIERRHEALKLGGTVREVTVMFADMRDFTPMSERLSPCDLLALLNRLFGALGAEIIARSGTIDKFIGDSVMAFWNAPVDVPDHAEKACLAALAMRTRLAALNAEGGSGEPVSIGIGLASGPALVGNLGLETRFDYSALGDTVNLASRVEGATKTVGYDILAAAETRRAAPGLAWLPAGAVVLKGKAVAAQVYLLVGDGTLAARPEFRALRAAHEAGEIGECRALAAVVEPGLVGFYDKAPRGNWIPGALKCQ
jgi:adenylate cyclase